MVSWIFELGLIFGQGRSSTNLFYTILLVHPLMSSFRICHKTTRFARPELFVFLPPLYNWFQLRPQIRDMERLFVDDGRLFVHLRGAIPAQVI